MNRQVVKIIQGGTTPKLYIKTIADLEDVINEATVKAKVSIKKMSASNTKGLNAMKQKIKKNNKDYAKDLESYREDKDKYMETDDEEEVVPVEKVKKPKVQRIEELDAQLDDEGFSTVMRGGRILQYTPESILKHLRSIVESRGKKNTDRGEQIRVMERLLEVATSPYQKIRVILTLISTRFDLTSTSTQNFMSQEQWRSAEKEFSTLLNILEESPEHVVTEHAEEWEDDEKAPQINRAKCSRSPAASCLQLSDWMMNSVGHFNKQIHILQSILNDWEMSRHCTSTLCAL